MSIMTAKIKDSVPLTASSLCVKNYEISVHTAQSTSIGSSFKLDNQPVQRDFFQVLSNFVYLGGSHNQFNFFPFSLLVKSLYVQVIPECKQGCIQIDNVHVQVFSETTY